jgi:hypothetical protein
MLWKVTRVKHVAETVENAWGDRDTTDLLVFTFPFSVPSPLHDDRGHSMLKKAPR